MLLGVLVVERVKTSYIVTFNNDVSDTQKLFGTKRIVARLQTVPEIPVRQKIESPLSEYPGKHDGVIQLHVI